RLPAYSGLAVPALSPARAGAANLTQRSKAISVSIRLRERLVCINRSVCHTFDDWSRWLLESAFLRRQDWVKCPHMKILSLAGLVYGTILYLTSCWQVMPTLRANCQTLSSFWQMISVMAIWAATDILRSARLISIAWPPRGCVSRIFMSLLAFALLAARRC